MLIEENIHTLHNSVSSSLPSAHADKPLHTNSRAIHFPPLFAHKNSFLIQVRF